MTFILDLIVFIFVLGIIVLIHEGGHFFFAKRAGILCHEFAVGMGPVLYQKTDGETVYSIRAIPIGGYVSMAGESVSDAMIKKDETIGLKLKDNKVEEIVLYTEGSYDVIGVVKDFDLYGKNMSLLYIEIETDQGTQKYEVSRTAKYIFSEKRNMWITPEEKSFESKSLWHRFITIFGGPLMNFILAFVLFFLVGFFILKPNYDSNEIGSVADSTLASSLGFVAGDQIVSINGDAVNSWYDLSTVMNRNNSTQIEIVIDRNGSLLTFGDDETAVVATYIQSAGISNVSSDGTIYPYSAIVGSTSGRAASAGLKADDVITKIDQTDITTWDDVIAFFRSNTGSGTIRVEYSRNTEIGFVTYDLISLSALESLGTTNIVYQIGVTASSTFDFMYSLSYAPRQFASNVSEVFTTIGLLFGGGESSLGVTDLSGPVGIFQLVSNVRANGFINLIVFMGFLSINIGILNLLPIPALDGGRLVFLGIEAVIRRPLNRRIENSLNLMMFFALIAFIIFVTYNDVFRIING